MRRFEFELIRSAALERVSPFGCQFLVLGRFELSDYIDVDIIVGPSKGDIRGFDLDIVLSCVFDS